MRFEQYDYSACEDCKNFRLVENDEAFFKNRCVLCESSIITLTPEDCKAIRPLKEVEK